MNYTKWNNFVILNYNNKTNGFGISHWLMITNDIFHKKIILNTALLVFSWIFIFSTLDEKI